jgi:hypothetical protein
VLARFAAHEIPALPYKGPVLAQRVYGSLAMRQVGDLDIVVRRRDVARARELLIARGYHSRRARIAIPGALRVEYQHRLVHPREHIVIELHWTITPRSVAAAPTLGELWERREIVPLLDIAFPSLGRDDLLLTLCLHGAKHRWRRLELIVSVAELLAQSSAMLDWDALTARAARLGNLRILRLGLALAGDVLDAPLPPAVRHTLDADAEVQSLAAGVCERLLPRAEGDDEDTRLDLHRFRIRAKERFTDRVRYLGVSLALSAVRVAGELAGRVEAWTES